MHNNLILIAIVPEALKDNMVDALMAETFLSGFSLSKTQGFSHAHSHYSVSEQVEGYRDFYRFEILHKVSESSLLLETLSKISANKNIRYWIMPLFDSGVV
jgi:hypothetical protein